MIPKDLLVEFMRRARSPSQEREVIESLPWAMTNVMRHKNILSAGDRPTALFLILEGWAGRYSLRRNGSRRITGFMLPGDLCGIHAVTGAKMDHSVIALTNCRIAKVPVATIEAAVRSAPSLGRALWHSKLMDEAILRRWLLNSDDAEIAIAHFICELYARMSAIGEVISDTFRMSITQADIGDALGLTAVHTNRIVGKLRKAGLVTISKGEVTIEDPRQLYQHCNFDPSYLHL